MRTAISAVRKAGSMDGEGHQAEAGSRNFSERKISVRGFALLDESHKVPGNAPHGIPVRILSTT